MQEKSDSLRKFLDRVGKLSVLYGFSTVQTCIKIGLARSLYYQIKDGKRPITAKLWRKLEEAERTAGIHATIVPESEKSVNYVRDADDLSSNPPKKLSLEARLDRLERLIFKLSSTHLELADFLKSELTNDS